MQTTVSLLSQETQAVELMARKATVSALRRVRYRGGERGSAAEAGVPQRGAVEAEAVAWMLWTVTFKERALRGR
jgi:hypothetical protein